MEVDIENEGVNKGRKKIAIMGLNNGGKTSIMFSLKGIKNIGAYNALLPTVGINIENIDAMGSDITIFDFGGQEEFRKSHLANLENHIYGTNTVIYVIDVQDTQRYELSLEYLKEIVEILKGINIKVDFTIFLHKNDPDLELLKRHIDDDKLNELIQKVKAIISQDFSYKFQKTSIYTVFEKSNID